MDHDTAPLFSNDTDVSVLFKDKSHSIEPINIQTPLHEAAPISSTSEPAKYFEFSLRGRCSFRLPLTVFNVFLTIMTILSSLMMAVTLPLFSASMVTESSKDEYPVLFFTALWFPVFFFGLVCISKFLDPETSLKSTVSHRVMVLIGGMNAINGVLVVYASDPARTSPQLQAILCTSVIPFTVICRYIIIRKGVSQARLVCTCIVLIGLFISLEPVIWNIDQQGGDGGGSGGGDSSGFAQVAWPFIFVLGFLPAGILNTLIERELKRDQTESIVFQSWVQLYTCIIIGLLFWTDFIPGFGAASNPGEFWENLKHGFNCMYGRDPACSDAVVYSILFIIGYCLASLFIFLLVRFAEGAVYLVTVQALVTPLGSIFWTLFKPDPSFHWEPVFNLATAFVLSGLVIMVPAVVFYNYFGSQEAKKKEAELKKATEQSAGLLIT